MEEQLKNQLKESYNKVAKIRDKSPIQQWKINEMDLFVNELQDLGQTKLLDLGAGPGLQSLYFQQQNIQVTAIDLSSEMVRLCKEKGIFAVEMDFSNLQFQNETFGAVWSMNSLLHVPKKSLRQILQNVANVLKEDGLFYLGTYGGFDSEGIWEKDSYIPKRFFVFYKEEHLKEIINEYFAIVSFRTLPIEGEGPDYFGMILRKK